jgi:hypothetical protein
MQISPGREQTLAKKEKREVWGHALDDGDGDDDDDDDDDDDCERVTAKCRKGYGYRHFRAHCSNSLWRAIMRKGMQVYLQGRMTECNQSATEEGDANVEIGQSVSPSPGR